MQLRKDTGIAAEKRRCGKFYLARRASGECDSDHFHDIVNILDCKVVLREPP